MCLQFDNSFSTYILPSPKAVSASLCADSIAPANSLGRLTTRIPFPPPPALALSSKGNPKLELTLINSLWISLIFVDFTS